MNSSINGWLERNMASIQTLGIIAGVLALVVTAWNTRITAQALALSQKQLEPAWEIDCDAAGEFSIKSSTHGVRIEGCDLHFPEKFGALDWNMTGPSPRWEPSVVKGELAKIGALEKAFDTKKRYGEIPVGIAIVYTQFGQRRRVSYLYDFTFTWRFENGEVLDFEPDALLFRRQLLPHEVGRDELDRLANSPWSSGWGAGWGTDSRATAN